MDGKFVKNAFGMELPMTAVSFVGLLEKQFLEFSKYGVHNMTEFCGLKPYSSNSSSSGIKMGEIDVDIIWDSTISNSSSMDSSAYEGRNQEKNTCRCKQDFC